MQDSEEVEEEYMFLIHLHALFPLTSCYLIKLGLVPYGPLLHKFVIRG